MGLGIFEKTEKNHVLEAGSHQRDGQTLVHARSRHGQRGFADFFCSTQENTLGACLSCVE